jgi:hypothetical protein
VSPAAVSRKASVLEALAVFAIIMAYIWKLRFTHPRFFPSCCANFHIARRASRARTGFGLPG